MAIFTVGFNPAIDRILECPDFHIGGHQTARQIARLAAGKAANVSRALAQLGTDSIATGFIGTDELEFFHSQLMAMGPGRILCRFIEVGGKTRENVSILDPQRRIETHLRDRGFDVTADEALLLQQKLLRDVRGGDLVVFSGSLCGGVTAEYFLGLLDRCTRTGARIVVDSSGEPLKQAMSRKVWLVKPNLEELRMLTGKEVPNAAAAVRDAAQALLTTTEFVLVSRGVAGAVLVSRKGALVGRVLGQEAAIRTVGCGDHLLAAFVGEMMAGQEVEPALRRALAVATARAVSRDMCEFDPEMVKNALEEVEIDTL